MPVKQAMLLAAGLSTRVRPLTDRVPKPLLPFWNRRILDFTLAYLQTAGVRSVAVNVHHGREEFLSVLKKIDRPNIKPFEEEMILGTGGGIKNMRPFITEKTFLVANCDFITGADLNAAVRFHLKKKSIATMVLIDRPFKKRYGEVGVDAKGRIVKFPHRNISGKPAKTGLFSGIHIFDRTIFNHMPLEKVFCINREVYAPLILKGAPVHGYVTKADWVDAGETKLYAAAQFSLLKKHPAWMKPFLKNFRKKPDGVWISPNAKLADGVKIKGPALISENARIGSGAAIGPNAVIGTGARIGSGAKIKQSVIYPDAEISRDKKVSRAVMMTAEPS